VQALLSTTHRYQGDLDICRHLSHDVLLELGEEENAV
jgi:hypothetical protein